MKRNLLIGLAVVLMIAILSLPGSATGAGISAEVYNAKPLYRVGEVITFKFGGLACDPEGADNIATFTAVMPDGVVIIQADVYMANGTSYVFYVDYVVKEADVQYTADFIPYVRAGLAMEGYDTLGGGFRFYASASAQIDLSEAAPVSPVVKVKKNNPRNYRSYK